MNDDLVQPSRGFGEHPHRDMEICTYIVSGNLTHQDSMGTAETSAEEQFSLWPLVLGYITLNIIETPIPLYALYKYNVHIVPFQLFKIF